MRRQRKGSAKVVPLQFGERLCVPRYKVGFHKHWWSSKLDDMKQRCIDITNLWTSVGRPRSGIINTERIQCKYRKQAIREAADDESKNMNDSLFNHLCSKDNVSFWKSWRRQFCSRNIQPTNLLHGKSGTEIFQEFTKYYTCVFQSNTANADAKFSLAVCLMESQ